MKSQPLGFLNGLDLEVCQSNWLLLKELASLTIAIWRNKFRWNGIVKRASNRLLDNFFLTLASNQARLPAELKHINKRRKRN